MVELPAVEPGARTWPVYAPVEPDRPVTIRARNTGDEPARVAIGLDVP